MAEPQGISKEERQLLADRLGALGGMGAAAVSRRLRADIFEDGTSVSLPLGRARELVQKVLSDCGQLIDPGVTPPFGEVVLVRAIVGAGGWNLNPTVVTVTLTESGPGQTEVRVRGVAKEGLIKQRAGQGAARRVLELLTGEARV